MPAVVEAASEQTRIGLVLADAEFDSERNHTYIRQQLGAQSMIPSKRGKKNWRVRDLRAQMRRAFPRGSTGADRSCVNEQDLFTRALSLAEKRGKFIHLAVAPATEKWEGILRAAQSLQPSTIALGLSSWRAVTDEARMAGLALEALPEPRPHLTLEIYSPSGQEHLFYLGPHAPRLTTKEIDLLHGLWLELSNEVAPEELHHHDVVHIALEELSREIHDGRRQEIIDALRKHLGDIRHPQTKI